MLGEAKDISGILPIIVSKHITLVTFNLSYQSLKKIKVQPQQKFHRVTNQILTCIVAHAEVQISMELQMSKEI